MTSTMSSKKFYFKKLNNTNAHLHLIIIFPSFDHLIHDINKESSLKTFWMNFLSFGMSNRDSKKFYLKKYHDTDVNLFLLNTFTSFDQLVLNTIKNHQ